MISETRLNEAASRIHGAEEWGSETGALMVLRELLAEAWDEGVQLVYEDFYCEKRWPVDEHVLIRNPYREEAE